MSREQNQMKGELILITVFMIREKGLFTHEIVTLCDCKPWVKGITGYVISCFTLLILGVNN